MKYLVAEGVNLGPERTQHLLLLCLCVLGYNLTLSETFHFLIKRGGRHKVLGSYFQVM